MGMWQVLVDEGILVHGKKEFVRLTPTVVVERFSQRSRSLKSSISW